MANILDKFIVEKAFFIGGTLQDLGDSLDRRIGFRPMETEIIDITIKANGTDSAFFEVVGKDFSCGFDVGHGGVVESPIDGWCQFNGYMGHAWRIKPRVV